MWRKRVARGFVPLVLAALLAGCDGGSGKGPESTLPPPPPSTTTTTIDVTKVPATIDVAYVQAVMNSLDKVTGDMVRTLVANKVPNAEFFALLQAIYDEPQFGVEQSDYGNYAALGLRQLSMSPGNPTSKVKRILDTSANCLVAEIDHDYGPIFREPPPEDEGGFIQLRSKKSERDPAGKNPTTWAIVADIDAQDAKIPQDPCK